MSNISALANIVGNAVRQARGADRVTTGQIKGNSVMVGGRSYNAKYAADVDKVAGKSVYAVIGANDECIVISDR